MRARAFPFITFFVRNAKRAPKSFQILNQHPIITQNIIMKIFPLILALVTALPLLTHGAAITSVTLDPSDDGTTMDSTPGQYDFASFTADGTTYTNLAGATATVTTGSSYFWVQNNGDPGSIAAAVSGLEASSYGNNIEIAEWQFGQSLENFEAFAFFDIGGGDSGTFTMIDSDGNDVGTTAYTFDFTGGDYGSTVYGTAANVVFKEGEDPGTESPTRDHDFGGFSFTLADFSGAGDMSTATGFRLDGDVDASPLIGSVIPEPHAGLLVLLGFAALIMNRRRRGIV